MATPSPVYLFKHVKHGTQNIQNDCHQWLCDSIRAHRFVFSWDSAPDPAGRAYSASPDPLAGLRGLLLRWEKGKGEERERRGSPPSQIPGSAPGTRDISGHYRITTLHFSKLSNYSFFGTHDRLKSVFYLPNLNLFWIFRFPHFNCQT